MLTPDNRLKDRVSTLILYYSTVLSETFTSEAIIGESMKSENASVFNKSKIILGLKGAFSLRNKYIKSILKSKTNSIIATFK